MTNNQLRKAANLFGDIFNRNPMNNEQVHEVAIILGELERKIAEDMDCFDMLKKHVRVPSNVIDGYESSLIWLSSLMIQVKNELESNNR